MTSIFGLLQSDPNLFQCQLERLSEVVQLAQGPAGVGLGYYMGNDVLLRKQPGVPHVDLAALGQGIESNAVVLSARGPGGPAFDDETAPFRFRRWLWVQAGEMEGFTAYRMALLSTLPEFLSRAVRTQSGAEHLFMAFASQLRERGRLDDIDLDAESASSALGQALTSVDALAAAVGQKPPHVAVLATNGRIAIAARRGRPLWYALLEGIVPCKLHGIEVNTPDTNPLARPHHRVRAVALASEVRRAPGWLEVPEASRMGVSRTLEVSLATI